MMLQKLKWVLAALVAGALAFLGLLYGKRTASVVRASMRENSAKERVLRTELKASEAQIQTEECEEKRRMHEERTETLTIKLSEIRAARDKEMGKAVNDDDDALAAGDNARRSQPNA